MKLLSRRLFLAGSVVASSRLVRGLEGVPDSHVLAHWNFSDGPLNKINSRTCEPSLTQGIVNQALHCDGYSAWLSRGAARAPAPGNEFTIELWVALESYPTSDAAFVNQRNGKRAGYFFGLDQFGFLRFELSKIGHWCECVSLEPIPRLEWVHVAASLHDSGQMSIFLNGARVSSAPGKTGDLNLAKTVDLLIGKTDGCDYISGVFPTGVVNGLVNEVVLHDKCLSEDAIRRISNSVSKIPKPALTFPTSIFDADLQRPVYHALPARAWTNEPHGLIRFNGAYHLFYQKNANGPYWGNMNWGHLTSPDLLRWTDQKPVLSPQPGFDATGCWSGSVIEHQRQLAIFYTAADGQKPHICLASSEDGYSFSKAPQNPVIPASPAELNHPDFRDPFVWAENEKFYLLVGSGIPDLGGTALLYRSADLVNWTYVRKLLQGTKANSGTFWEMPVFFSLGKKHVLIVCEVPGRSSYWIGDWKDEQFYPDQEAPTRLEILNHFLSPTPYRDEHGRLITIGIIPETRSPRETWKAGWAHLYSLPRVLSLDENGSLRQEPLPELATLRGESFPLADKNLASVRGMSLEIRARFSRDSAVRTGLRLRRTDDGQEETLLYYDWTDSSLTLDRTRSSLNSDVVRDLQSGAFSLGPDEPLDLHVLVDHSVLEVFVNGRGTLASRIYPIRSDSDGMSLFYEGGAATLEHIEIWRMNRA